MTARAETETDTPTGDRQGRLWAQHVAAWSRPPVDDVGYVPAVQLLQLSDPELRHIIRTMHRNRYTGYRNHNGLWRQVMGLDDTTDKDVLDYGCGVGLESLELARAGNRVSVADISPANLKLTRRVLEAHGAEPSGVCLIPGEHTPERLGFSDGSFDVFHCNGVLHHSRYPAQVLAEAHRLLRPGGIARVMVYSDRGWRVATGTEPPDRPDKDPMFRQFVRFFDSVGEYADWYNPNRLARRAGALALEQHEYLTPDGRFLGAVLRKEP